MIACVLAAIVGMGCICLHDLQLEREAQRARETPVPTVPAESVAQASPADDTGNSPLTPLPENPIDFKTLQAQNPNIYAWVYIPDTNVNHPILQHPSDDDFYLDHNQDDEESPAGAIYTERANSRDFTDPVTVIYGHHMKGGLMFATLHDFEDSDFFCTHRKLYIYTPGHVYTYNVVAAYGTSDDHILNTNELSSEKGVAEYFRSVLNPLSNLANIRKKARLIPADRIVQLSTCNYSSSDPRYVVTAKLVKDQPTR